MPPESMVNKDYLKGILSGEKKLLKMSEVNFCHPPAFDEIAVKNLYERIKASPGMAELFPDTYAKGRQCCRAYMFNCWNTIHPNDFKAVVAHASEQRYSVDNDRVKDNSIKITESWRQELDKMPFVSKHRGRMSALLKQKSRVTAASKPRKKYDAFDFSKKIKSNDGAAVTHPAPQQPPEEVKKEIIAPKKIKPLLVEKFDQEMKD